MSLLSSLFSSQKKTNLTPNVTPQMPSQTNPGMYANLSNLASNDINGIGTGFSPDFVNNATNPVASAMRRNYQNVTAPTINSNYSSRGLGNSSLAANAQGLAEGNVESDIGSLMAQFQTLNEQQKKTDQQFGAGLGQNILSGDVAQQNQIAAQSERLANNTAAQNNTSQAVDRGVATQDLSGLVGAATGGISGGLTGAATGFQNGMTGSMNNQNASLQALAKILNPNYSPKTNIAGIS